MIIIWEADALANQMHASRLSYNISLERERDISLFNMLIPATEDKITVASLTFQISLNPWSLFWLLLRPQTNRSTELLVSIFIIQYLKLPTQHLAFFNTGLFSVWTCYLEACLKPVRLFDRSSALLVWLLMLLQTQNYTMLLQKKRINAKATTIDTSCDKPKSSFKLYNCCEEQIKSI